MRAGKNGCLEHANNKADGVQLVYVGGAGGRKRGDAPEDLERGQQPARELGAGHEHQAGHLEDDVGGKVRDVEVVELVAVEAKVLLEAADVGIANVCLVCGVHA